VGIKKFVVILLVVSIVSLVPLQALAQVEPRITYDEWCAHLAELHVEHTELEAKVAAETAAVYSAYLWAMMGGALVGVGVGFLDWADFEDYLADKYWSYVSKADEYRAAGSLLLVAGCAIVVLYLIDVVQRARKTEALYGDRTIADILREIELWEQAGVTHMWFYPCE